MFLAAPNGVKDLALASTTVNSLTVQWTAPTGGYTEYKVTIGGADEQTVAKGTTTATFSGLTAGTEYTVAVITVNNADKSSKVEESFYTSKYETLS